jgi:RHS repeat-associated protein
VNHYKFTGKERDSESGLDNFRARFDSSYMGRFMTPDPVVITPERLHDPQQMNAYSYVRNNPLGFVDPTGMTLTVSGDTEQATHDLCLIAGDQCDRITVDQKTGTVSFNTEGLDLSKNEGAALINDIVASQNHYDFSVGATVETAGGSVHIDHLVNLDNNYDQRYDIRNPPGKVNTEKPKTGVDDQVGLNPKADVKSDTKLELATQDSLHSMNSRKPIPRLIVQNNIRMLIKKRSSGNKS